MDKEITILNEISQNERLTQRQLAESTGFSLGTVNLLLKKMVKTGLVKIERLNKKTIQYILTPKGMLEKTEKTYQYIVDNYKKIQYIKEVVLNIVNDQIDKKTQNIYFYGEKDAFYEIIKMSINEFSHDENINIKFINNIKRVDISKKYLVVLWNNELEEKLNRKLKYINLLMFI